MKAIETEYKGYKFRSRLEARWAVFFDACGVKWEYEPQGFDLGNGLYYLPDFLLHDVLIRDPEREKARDIYVEVKGQMTEKDADKIARFPAAILVVGKIPDGESYYDEYGESSGSSIMGSIKDANEITYPFEVTYYDFNNIDNDVYTVFPGVDTKGNFVLFGGDYTDNLDENASVNAYRRARQARFEYQDNINLARPVDLQTAPNGTYIDILTVDGESKFFVKAARVYSAITGSNANITSTHPIIRAADSIGAKCYRFATQRLSGNNSFGSKAYYFAIKDVPKILAQYVEHHHHSKDEQQMRYNKNAAELSTWFYQKVFAQYVLLPTYGRRIDYE